jgi:pyrimidine deaminase RibD-like protein
VPEIDKKRKYFPRELMELAVQLAHQSKSEADNRVHPMVGAIVERDGYILQTGFRGDLASGKHAEESALKKFARPSDAKDTTVYTTLEPCTERGAESCSSLLLRYGIRKMVYGMLDPNPDIRGRGEWRLEESHVQVAKFDADFVEKIRQQNVDFIDYMQGIGVHIVTPGEDEKVISPIAVEGTYRIRPRSGDNIRLLVVRGIEHFPQNLIDWSTDSRTWRCFPVHLGGGAEPVDYSIVIARVSDDLDVALRHYSRVGSKFKNWVGLEMSVRPRGFEVLGSVRVTRLGRSEPA